MPPPVLRSIQVGLPKTLRQDEAADGRDRTWTTASYKEPIAGPARVGRTHVEGDGQADAVNHGGPDKAVCAYSADHYEYWRREWDLPALPFGAFGENFTIEGLAEPDVCVGDVWRVGDVRLEISQPRQPCWKLARRWGIKDLVARIHRNGRTGWYFRVRSEGVVAPGLPLALEERPFPSWTIERANRVNHHPDVLAEVAELAAVPALSESWRKTLAKKLG